MLENAYSYFYWRILTEFKLTPTQGLLFTLIINLSKRTGSCYASKETLAETLNISSASVYNNLRVLKAKGLIEAEGISEHGVVRLMATGEWDNLSQEIQKEITERKKDNDASIKFRISRKSS